MFVSFPLRVRVTTHRIRCMHSSIKRSSIVDRLCRQLAEGRRSALAQAITLVESAHPRKRAQAQSLLSTLLSRLRQQEAANNGRPSSFRIGLTGPPGAGKSTLIESLGTYLTAKQHKVAVLAVDPSSSRTGGSLLGDKTRMVELSRDPRAYIRASPTQGTLGGVNRSTNEAIVLCEAAGYDVILVETVGVGQSEYAVAEMVDMFVLLVSPAGGDELQGLKRGIVELADVVAVNKADGQLLPAARKTQVEYSSALRLVRKKVHDWRPKVLKLSSVTKEGLPDLWHHMLDYQQVMLENGELMRKRETQHRAWMWNYIRDNIMQHFRSHPRVRSQMASVEAKVARRLMTPGLAADLLLSEFFKQPPLPDL